MQAKISKYIESNIRKAISISIARHAELCGNLCAFIRQLTRIYLATYVDLFGNLRRFPYQAIGIFMTNYSAFFNKSCNRFCDSK